MKTLVSELTICGLGIGKLEYGMWNGIKYGSVFHLVNYIHKVQRISAMQIARSEPLLSI